jgi:hypothetical protein
MVLLARGRAPGGEKRLVQIIVVVMVDILIRWHAWDDIMSLGITLLLSLWLTF